MKLNTEYLKAAGMVVAGIIWTILAMAIFAAIVMMVVKLNLLGLLAVIFVAFVFAYLTVMVCDKLDFL